MSEKKLYDLTLINQVAKGNTAFIRRLCVAFVTGSYEALEQMNAAVATNNHAELSRVAHKVKSTIDTMNVTEAKVLIREIETLAGHQLPTEAPELMQKLNRVIKEVSAEIIEDFELTEIKIPR